jgi:hypothetical protein
MEVLERYLSDCEAKRRRMRDRPSNEVLSELRRLLTRFNHARPREGVPSDEPAPRESGSSSSSPSAPSA